MKLSTWYMGFVSPAEKRTAKELRELSSLMKQLKGQKCIVTEKDIRTAAAHSHVLFVHTKNKLRRRGTREWIDMGEIIGLALLIPVHKIDGRCGLIEEVVVDKQYRRLGVGRSMMDALIDRAHSLGLRYLDLTTRPKRKEANNLYPSLGFVKRNTNAYRLGLSDL